MRLRTYRNIVRARGVPNALLHGRGALPPGAAASAGALPPLPTSFAGLRQQGVLRDADNPASTYFVVTEALAGGGAAEAGAADAAGRAAAAAVQCTVFVPVAADGVASQWERRARGHPDRTFLELSRDNSGLVLFCVGEETVRLELEALVRVRDGARIATGEWHDGPAAQGTPWHLADVVWRFAPSASAPLESFSVDVSVHAAPRDGAQTPPLYIAPAFARIAVAAPASSAGVDGRLRYRKGDCDASSSSDAVPFYGGLQTHTGGLAPHRLADRGRGESAAATTVGGREGTAGENNQWRDLGSAAIFSRWNVRSRDALRTAGDANDLLSAWESGGYEGPFVSVRRQLACPQTVEERTI